MPGKRAERAAPPAAERGSTRSPVLAAAGLLALVLAGCGTDDPSVTAEQADLPVVVTSLRPLAEAATRVAGDDVVVINLTPVAESPHELELTARQRQEILDADLAIVLGKGFQPSVERVAGEREGPTLEILEELALPDRADGTAGPPDPHVWLDPTIMGSIVTAVADAVGAVAPEHADRIASRAERVVEEHVRLDAQLAQGLRSCERRVIASQHEAFGWLAARYGFTNVGFDAAIPDDDPAPDLERTAEVAARVDDGEVTTVFLETLSPTSWLEVFAEERGLDTAVLNPYEGLTSREAADGATYRSVLLYDLRVLQDALDCATD